MYRRGATNQIPISAATDHVCHKVMMNLCAFFPNSVRFLTASHFLGVVRGCWRIFPLTPALCFIKEEETEQGQAFLKNGLGSLRERFPRKEISRMGSLNRNAAFRRQGTTGPGPSSCRLKAAFRGGFMGREQTPPDRKSCAQLCEALQMLYPPHEPQGRARLSPARRAADAKWKRRARDRRALPLLGSGVDCANFSENSLPEGEGRGEGKLGQQPRKVCGN